MFVREGARPARMSLSAAFEAFARVNVSAGPVPGQVLGWCDLAWFGGGGVKG